MKLFLRKYAVYGLVVFAITDQADYWLWKITGHEPEPFNWVSFVIFIGIVLIFNWLMDIHDKAKKENG